MKKISAATLQEALSQAAAEFGCSVTDIEYEVAQYESKGVLGLFKKPAIIIAQQGKAARQAGEQAERERDGGLDRWAGEDTAPPSNASTATLSSTSSKLQTDPLDSSPLESKREALALDSLSPLESSPDSFLDSPQKQATRRKPSKEAKKAEDSALGGENKEDRHRGDREGGESEFFDASEFLHNLSPTSPAPASPSSPASQATSSHALDSHPESKMASRGASFLQTREEILAEITADLTEMFRCLPYKIHTIEVAFFDTQTLAIYLDGLDSALLIGERGYRYKALSYLLFNWIQPTYGYNIRLEIAQFLHNQEEATHAYLVGIINEVQREGRAQTKPLDGVLAFIALKKLRETFPDKYIAFRLTPQNERYIIINDFYR